MPLEVLHSAAEWKERFGAAETVVTVGNFDGIHLGHQRILRGVAERAPALRALAAAVTFDPHPLKILRPADAPPLIATLAQRLARLEQLGLNAALVLRFVALVGVVVAGCFATSSPGPTGWRPSAGCAWPA